MTIVSCTRICFAACLFAAPAFAQTDVPVLGALLNSGQTIEVIDDRGRETRGKVGVVSATSVTIDSKGGATVIPLGTITQIARPADGLANGALIGLAVGAAFGALGSTVGTTDCPEVSFCDDGPGFVAGSILIFGAVGTGIGVGVDALFHHSRLIYVRDGHPRARLAPIIGRHGTGALVSVTW